MKSLRIFFNAKNIREAVESIALFALSGVSIFNFWNVDWIKKEEWNMLWHTFLIICAILIVILIIWKINEIFSIPWTKCKGFPHTKFPDGKQMCTMVEYCLSNNRYHQAKNTRNLTSEKIARDKLFYEFFNEVTLFLERSKRDLKMTLPQNPYFHIKDNERKVLFKNTAVNVEKYRIKKKEKLICLTTQEYNDFILDIKADIINNLANIKIYLRDNKNATNKYPTQFGEYLALHKGISIFWHIAAASSIEEFIIIDDCACISCASDKIIVSFSTDDIMTKIKRFNDVGEKISTQSFLATYVFEQINSDRTISDEDKKIIIEYLKKVK